VRTHERAVVFYSVVDLCTAQYNNVIQNRCHPDDAFDVTEFRANNKNKGRMGRMGRLLKHPTAKHRRRRARLRVFERVRSLRNRLLRRHFDADSTHSELTRRRGCGLQ